MIKLYPQDVTQTFVLLSSKDWKRYGATQQAQPTTLLFVSVIPLPP